MAERLIVPIIKRRRANFDGTDPVPHLLLTVEGEGADLRPDKVSFTALAAEDSRTFQPTERVGRGPILIPFGDDQQVRLLLSYGEQTPVITGPVWEGFYDYAAGLGVDVKASVSRGLEMATWNLPEDPILLETTNRQVYGITPIRLVAAGLRLAHAHFARGNP
jgi:hypothetical protein